MAGNFWKSSHYGQWVLTKERMIEGHELDAKSLSIDDVKKLHIFFANFIQVVPYFITGSALAWPIFSQGFFSPFGGEILKKSNFSLKKTVFLP